MRSRIRSGLRRAFVGLGLVAGLVGVAATAAATEQSPQRQGARDTRQDTKQDARQEKVDCRQENNKSNAACQVLSGPPSCGGGARSATGALLRGELLPTAWRTPDLPGSHRGIARRCAGRRNIDNRR